MTIHKCFNPDCDAEVDKKGKYCVPCKKARTREFAAISNAKAAEKKLKAREVQPLACAECGKPRERAYDRLCSACRQKAQEERETARAKAKADEEAALTATKETPKPLPRVTLSDEERDALDREKRKSDEAADAALAERRRQVNADMLMARLMVGAVVPVIPTGYASPKVEYQPPQRAQTLAADRMAMWE